MQLLPMASSPDGLISARYAVITKTPGWEVLTTTSNVNVTQGHGCWGGGGQKQARVGNGLKKDARRAKPPPPPGRSCTPPAPCKSNTTVPKRDGDH